MPFLNAIFLSVKFFFLNVPNAKYIALPAPTRTKNVEYRLKNIGLRI